MNPYQGGYVAPSVPQNQVSSVPTGWIDIPGCYLGPPEYYTGNCGASGDPMSNAMAVLAHGVPNSPALPPLPALTPANILQPLPDITLATLRTPLPIVCSKWAELNGWIAANPAVAVAALLILAAVGWPRK